MRVQQVQIENTTVTHVYVSEEELKNIENKEKLEELKENNKNVVIFQAGNKSTKEVLTNMIQKMTE